MKRLGRAVCDDQTSILGAPERRNGALDFASPIKPPGYGPPA
jgi:hypothetical protein